MVAIPLYVLFILLLSLFLNGSIVLAFFKKKYVRTQLNLFTDMSISAVWVSSAIF